MKLFHPENTEAIVIDLTNKTPYIQVGDYYLGYEEDPNDYYRAIYQLVMELKNKSLYVIHTRDIPTEANLYSSYFKTSPQRRQLIFIPTKTNIVISVFKISKYPIKKFLSFNDIHTFLLHLKREYRTVHFFNDKVFNRSPIFRKYVLTKGFSFYPEKEKSNG